MATTFLDQYLSAPQSVREFIYSDEYHQLLEEYLKKFEIDHSKEIDFIYLIQDLVFRVIAPKSIMELKEEIKSKLNLDENLSNQIAYTLFNFFLPKINNIWQEGESKEKSEKIEPEISELIKKIEEVKKKTKPTRMVNLQKLIPRKEKEEKVVNLQVDETSKLMDNQKPKVIKIQIPKIETEGLQPTKEQIIPQEEIKVQIPQVKTEGLTSTSWSKKEEKEEEKKENQTKIVIIKKQKPAKDDEVIDLSSY
jgi:hypothetical protein